MIEPEPTPRARLALEERAGQEMAGEERAGEEGGGGARPAIRIGRFAPYPVWMTMTVLARGAQLLFFVFCLWSLVALADAIDRVRTPLPPMEIWLATIVLGASNGRGRWRTSPFGDTLGNILASPQCPAYGQNVFDHTPPSGYAPPSQTECLLPSRICTNCGHDLRHRRAG